MEYRSLGQLQVSVLGLGTSRLASLGARVSSALEGRLLDVATDVGVNFIDTADTYGSSDCERLLGDLLRTRRGKFHVGTKGGFTLCDFPPPLRILNQYGKKALQATGHRQDFRPATLTRRIDASLRRLRIDVIDAYYLHEPPADVLLSADVLAVLVAARDAGKIREIGVGGDDVAMLHRAAGVGPLAVVQTSVNPVVSTAQTAALAAIVAAGRHVVANRALRVPDSAGRFDTTALLRHAAAQPNVSSVLVGTSNVDHLQANAEAFDRPITSADSLT